MEEALIATKPRTASRYDKTQVAHVRATCLYVATKLGDLLDEVVVVGGLVPSLLIGQGLGGEDHIGTADLDIGLALAVFDDQRYQILTDRLRQAGFGPDVNEDASSAERDSSMAPFLWVRRAEAPKLRLPAPWTDGVTTDVVNGERAVLFQHPPRLDAVKRYLSGDPMTVAELRCVLRRLANQP